MRIECEACGHLGDAIVRPTAGGVELECTACNHVAMLGGAAPAKQSPEPLPPSSSMKPVSELATPKAISVDIGEGEHRCPKCGWRQDDPAACHRCGLVFKAAVMSGKARPWEKMPPGQEMAAKELDKRWQTLVEGDFMDAEAHEAFMQFAQKTRLLERAASRYRFFAQDHQEDPKGDRAEASLARIIDMLNATFFMGEAGKSPENDKFVSGVGKFKNIIYLVFTLICIGILGLALFYQAGFL